MLFAAVVLMAIPLSGMDYDKFKSAALYLSSHSDWSVSEEKQVLELIADVVNHKKSILVELKEGGDDKYNGFIINLLMWNDVTKNDKFFHGEVLNALCEAEGRNDFVTMAAAINYLHSSGADSENKILREFSSHAEPYIREQSQRILKVLENSAKSEIDKNPAKTQNPTSPQRKNVQHQTEFGPNAKIVTAVLLVFAVLALGLFLIKKKRNVN